jgi:hypothetical protein
LYICSSTNCLLVYILKSTDGISASSLPFFP